MPTNIDTLTEREFVAGLMRGNESQLQLGYSAEAAVMAVANQRDIADDSPEYARLLSFAKGFAIALNAMANPNLYADFHEGLEEGMNELGCRPTWVDLSLLGVPTAEWTPPAA